MKINAFPGNLVSCENKKLKEFQSARKYDTARRYENAVQKSFQIRFALKAENSVCYPEKAH